MLLGVRDTGALRDVGNLSSDSDSAQLFLKKILKKGTQSNASAKILKKALGAELSALLWDLTRGKGLYHTTGANGAKAVYLAGDYSSNHRESGNFGMVYEVYAVG